MNYLTPRAKIVENTRIALQQDRTPAYGDCLAKLVEVERELEDIKVMKIDVDVDDLLTKCVPGGQSCDPQNVADNIREYLCL